MKAIFQKIRQLLGKDPDAGNVNFPKRIRNSKATAKGRGSRSYREGSDHHDRWVECLSPHAVVCAAKELAPRWHSLGRDDRLPKALEIWRIQRHAALMRRIKRERLPFNS